ncbi:MAG: GspE/PulE family protein [Patescibacteria group bacterium]|nr:GspE/PulE family protein [Patescibacteria group bacterium]
MATKAEDTLLKMNREAEERDAQRRAERLAFPYLDLALLPIETDALLLVPEKEAIDAKIAAIENKSKDVVLVVFDPSDPKALAQIKAVEAKGLKPKIFVVSMSSLKKAWDFYKFAVKSTEPLTGRINIDKDRLSALKEKLIRLDDVHQAITTFDYRNNPTGQILEIVLAGAMANRASDIHFEPGEKQTRIRYRIDGDLRDVMSDLDMNIYKHLLSRIKLLADLKLNVGDKAQDGRITIGFGEGKDIELRVAIAPSEYGEVIVMRILDPSVINLSMAQLGFRPDDLKIVETELKRPNGMILNTGPTGSGKTTTLYAFLREKASPDSKIITIEDPIEYHLEGIEQTQVDPEADYTFANGLRSMMRQDPDIILIGEIRDKETAEIAIQASLTGHLVFSTVHANRASGAIPRLEDLGVRTTSIGPAMNLIIAQRLLKRLCVDCKKKAAISDEMKSKLEKFVAGLPARVNKDDYKNFDIYEPVGCEKCGGTGYKGRVGIYELLKITKEIEEILTNGGGEIQIDEFAKEKEGMVNMQEDGILKVIQGLTTFDEVEKITGPLEELEN